ncbi:MAG TPA: nitronate monooxygenase [Deferrimonas sp.]
MTVSASFPPPVVTPFTRQFGLRYPVICAPMFLVSSASLVISAGNAGGMGAFPALNYRPPERIREAIRQIRQESSAPFAINIIMQKSNRDRFRHLELALEEEIPLIITSLGHPGEAIRLAHQGNSRVYCDVVGLDHARKVADLGADGLVAVSYGAGGHAGTLTPFALIPLLARHFPLPVVAAGGIVDGAGLAAALCLGAAAAYMGTRFIASCEAEVTSTYKEAVVAAGCHDIVNTERVDGYPGNFIRTPALDALGLEPSLAERILSGSRRARRSLARVRAARVLFGAGRLRATYKTVFSAGQGAGLIDDIPSVQQIMEETIRQYHTIKGTLP